MVKVLVKDIATTVGKHIVLKHGNVTYSGVVKALSGQDLVLNAGFNDGFLLHLDIRLIRDEYVSIVSE